MAHRLPCQHTHFKLLCFIRNKCVLDFVTILKQFDIFEHAKYFKFRCFSSPVRKYRIAVTPASALASALLKMLKVFG